MENKGHFRVAFCFSGLSEDLINFTQMNTPLRENIQQLIRYNTWASVRTAEWMKTLPDEVLHRPLLSSFPSMDKTMQHILRTQKFWMKFICGEAVHDFDWSIRNEASHQLLDEWIHQSQEMEHCIVSQDEVWLLEKLKLEMPWSRNQQARYTYIQHVVNHGSFHRGQLITLARQCGISDLIPACDLNIFFTPEI